MLAAALQYLLFSINRVCVVLVYVALSAIVVAVPQNGATVLQCGSVACTYRNTVFGSLSLC